jgi:hypothetical protein
VAFDRVSLSRVGRDCTGKVQIDVTAGDVPTIIVGIIPLLLVDSSAESIVVLPIAIVGHVSQTSGVALSCQLGHRRVVVGVVRHFVGLMVKSGRRGLAHRSAFQIGTIHTVVR